MALVGVADADAARRFNRLLFIVIIIIESMLCGDLPICHLSFLSQVGTAGRTKVRRGARPAPGARPWERIGVSLWQESYIKRHHMS